MAEKTAAALTAEQNGFWDLAVRVEWGDGREIGFGLLLNERAALVALDEPADERVRVLTLVSKLIVDAGIVGGPDGPALLTTAFDAASWMQVELYGRDGVPSGAPVVPEGT